MFKVFLAMLMLAAFGVSSVDTCAEHLSSAKQAGVSAQADSHQSTHQMPTGSDHSKDHCCQAHCGHVAAMPDGAKFVITAVVSKFAFRHFVSYSDPSIIKNTRPPLAV